MLLACALSTCVLHIACFRSHRPISSRCPRIARTSGPGPRFHSSSRSSRWPTHAPSTTQTYGNSRPCSRTRTYSKSTCNIYLSASSQQVSCVRQTLKSNDRYPTHSLLRYLLVSNSLDLILDVSLETWSATVGRYYRCWMRIEADISRRIRSTIRPTTDIEGACRP